jgi:hypothetical protein
MMDEHDEVALLDGYALGTLAPAEREHMRAHLASCASCRREVDELRNIFDVLPHATPELAPTAASRDRLLARIDALEPAAPPVVPKVVPLRIPWAGLLAAGFVLALAADGWLAWQLHDRTTVAVVAPSPIAAASASPATVVVVTPTAAAIRPAARPTPDAGAVRRVALLERELADARRAADDAKARDAARIRALEVSLARASAELAAVERATPRPVAVASAAPAAALVAALSAGHVYGVDGVVGSQPWHLTIVQPPNGANAVIYSQVPDAPSGDTYRTWVLRDGRTFDAGELPAATQAKLEMPMPLQDGDVVAFSREPIGTGDRPTTAFLMQITIKT